MNPESLLAELLAAKPAQTKYRLARHMPAPFDSPSAVNKVLYANTLAFIHDEATPPRWWFSGERSGPETEADSAPPAHLDTSDGLETCDEPDRSVAQEVADETSTDDTPGLLLVPLGDFADAILKIFAHKSAKESLVEALWDESRPATFSGVASTLANAMSEEFDAWLGQHVELPAEGTATWMPINGYMVGAVGGSEYHDGDRAELLEALSSCVLHSEGTPIDSMRVSDLKQLVAATPLESLPIESVAELLELLESPRDHVERTGNRAYELPDEVVLDNDDAFESARTSVQRGLSSLLKSTRSVFRRGDAGNGVSTTVDETPSVDDALFDSRRPLYGLWIRPTHYMISGLAPAYESDSIDDLEEIAHELGWDGSAVISVHVDGKWVPMFNVLPDGATRVEDDDVAEYLGVRYLQKPWPPRRGPKPDLR